MNTLIKTDTVDMATNKLQLQPNFKFIKEAIGGYSPFGDIVPNHLRSIIFIISALFISLYYTHYTHKIKEATNLATSDYLN